MTRRRSPAARGNRRVDRDRSETRRRRTVRLVRAALILGAVGFAGWHGVRFADSRGWLDPFRVREVRVSGVRLAHPAVLVAEAGLMGREIHYWTPLGEYVRRVERDPLVLSARFQRRFPNRLTLEIRERVPVALIELDRLAPVDSAGRVLPVSAFHGDFDVPILTVERGPGAVASGGLVRDAAVRAMLSRLGQIGVHYPVLAREISAVRMERNGTIALTLVHADGEVVMDGETPLVKLALVDDVISDLRRKGVAYERLDLRFADQIVVRPARRPPAPLPEPSS